MLDIERVTYRSDGFSLSDISIHIPCGVAVGIIGRNGCGKTTLFKLITDLLSPESGKISIFGKSIDKLSEAEKQRIAIIDPDILYFKGQHSAVSLLGKLSEIYIEFNSAVYMQKLKAFEIPPKLPTARLSRGQYAKLLFAIALSCNSKLLLIDEASDGLDFENRESVFRELRNFMLSGGSVLFASHNFTDIESICDEVILIDSGKVKLRLSTDEIKEKYDVADVSYEELECIDSNAILTVKGNGYSSSALVIKERVNQAFIKRKASFSEIIEMLLEYMRIKL